MKKNEKREFYTHKRKKKNWIKINKERENETTFS